MGSGPGLGAGRLVYLELTTEAPGSEAVAAMRSLRASLERETGFRGARLLRSLDDPRILLLEVGWSGADPPAPPATLPGRLRVWSFTVIG